MSRTSKTFTAPNGVKLRCASHRRYWVVSTWTDSTGTARAEVHKRTDSTLTAFTEWRRVRGRAIYDSARDVYQTEF
jgi:hypothetical protein